MIACSGALRNYGKVLLHADCTQIGCSSRAPVRPYSRGEKFGLVLRQPKHRFVINDAFGRDLHQNESDVEVGDSEDARCQDDRRSVATREDFLAYEFHALVVQPGLHAIPGPPSHGQDSAGAALGDCRHGGHALRLSAPLRLPGREILRAAW